MLMLCLYYIIYVSGKSIGKMNQESVPFVAAYFLSMLNVLRIMTWTPPTIYVYSRCAINLDKCKRRSNEISLAPFLHWRSFWSNSNFSISLDDDDDHGTVMCQRRSAQHAKCSISVFFLCTFSRQSACYRELLNILPLRNIPRSTATMCMHFRR